MNRREFLKTGPVLVGIAGEAFPAGDSSRPGRIPLSAKSVRIGVNEKYRFVGEEIAARLYSATGIQIPVIPDTAADTLWHTHDLLLIGNLQNNAAMARLYSAGKAFIDASFPGSGGFVVQTLPDPLRSGHNVILIGGSDREGIESAAREFLSRVKSDRILPALHSVVSSLLPEAGPSAAESEHDPIAKYKKENGPHAALLTGQEIPLVLEQNRRNFDIGRGAGTLNNIISYGIRFHFTANPVWAQLFRGSLLDYIEIANRRGGWDFDPMIGSFFRISRIVECWELIQTSEVFSPPDRQKISAAFLDMGRSMSQNPLAGRKANPPGEPRQNHTTFLGLSIDAVVRYFQGRAHPEAAEWAEIPRRIFDGQATSAEANDDAGDYAWYSPMHTFEYFARHAKDVSRTEFLSRLPQVADRAIAVTDNRRDIVSYGDVGSYSPWARVEWPEVATVLSRSVWAKRDPGHQWAYLWLTEGKKPPVGTQLYSIRIDAQMPQRLLGIFSLTLDASALGWIARRYPGWTPRREANYVDKISFRRQFDPSSEYMLLDGSAAFAHGHCDANAITRLTWHDRIWLVDLDYIRATPHYHNSIEIAREGRTAVTPPLAMLALRADWGSIGVLRTVLENYNGADWGRCIFWIKGRYFIVLDQIQAKLPGKYDLTCRWRVLGKEKLDGGQLEITQPEAAFRIVNADDSRLSVRVDEPGLSDWSAYPHADGIVRVFTQKKTSLLKAGQNTWFANLLYARPDSRKEDLALRQIEDGLVAVEGRQGREVLGLAPEIRSVGHIRIQASMFYVDEDRFAAASLSRLECSAGRIQTDLPVDLHLENGKGRLLASQATKIEIEGSWRFPDSTVRGELQPGEYRIEFDSIQFLQPGERLPVSRGARQSSPEMPSAEFGMVRKWTADAGSGIVHLIPFQSSEPRWAAGLKNGRVLNVDSNGTVRVHCETGVPVRCLALTDRETLIVGDRDAGVSAYNKGGQRLWRHELPPSYGRIQRIVKMCLQPHRNGSRLIVGTEGWRVHAFDLDGALLWTTSIRYHAVTDLAVADLDGDGQHEIAVGTQYSTPLNILGPDGDLRWFTWEMVGEEVRSSTPYAGTHLRAMAVAELEKGTGPSIIYGTETHEVYAFRPNQHLEWSANVGGEVNGIAVHDWNGDGRAGIVTGTDSGYLAMLDSRGNRLWWRRLSCGITALHATTGREGGTIFAGCEDGTIAAYNPQGKLLALSREPTGITQILTLNDGSVLTATAGGRLSLLQTVRP